MAKMLSIDVGCSTTKIVEMDYQSKKPKVYKCIEIPTPQGAVIDGYLTPAKLESLREAIKDTLKNNKIRTKRVLFTVFSGKIISREVVLPGVKEHQINAIIESNVNEYFPIDLEDYKISHMKINTLSEGENAGKHKVLVIAMERNLIECYEKLAELLGLNIVDIDYAGNSAFQSVKNSAGVDAVMMVKVEDENALVTIVKKGIMVMQRTVNYNMGRNQDEGSVSSVEAARVLVGTILRVIDFYASNNDEGGSIDKIYVTGEGSKEEAIIELIHEQTQLNCMPLDVIRGANITAKVEDQRINVFAAAIGAGISSVGFDTEKEKQRHETNYVSASLLMVILIIVIAVTILAVSIIPYNAAVLEQKALEKKKQQLEPARIVYEQYNGMLALSAKVRYGRAITQHSNDAILDFLDELELMLPSDVEVTDFSSDDEQCVITMTVADKETAAGVINNLRDFESLSSITVESIMEETKDNSEEADELSSDNTMISFTVTAMYNTSTPVEPVTTTTDTDTTTDTADDTLE